MLNPDTGLDPIEGFPVVDGAYVIEVDADPLAAAATIAFGHMVDETATVEDLEAYRAWIVTLRLEGWTEDELASSVAVADHLAAKLGLA